MLGGGGEAARKGRRASPLFIFLLFLREGEVGDEGVCVRTGSSASYGEVEVASALSGVDSPGRGAHETRFGDRASWCWERTDLDLNIFDFAVDGLAQGLDMTASTRDWLFGRGPPFMMVETRRRLAGEGVIKFLKDFTDKVKSGLGRPDCFVSGVEGWGGYS